MQIIILFFGIYLRIRRKHFSYLLSVLAFSYNLPQFQEKIPPKKYIYNLPNEIKGTCRSTIYSEINDLPGNSILGTVFCQGSPGPQCCNYVTRTRLYTRVKTELYPLKYPVFLRITRMTLPRIAEFHKVATEFVMMTRYEMLLEISSAVCKMVMDT